jgi:integrase
MASYYARKVKNGVSYTLQWTGQNGKRQRVALGKVTEDEAHRAVLEKELEIINGCPDSINVPLLDDYVIEYKRQYKILHPHNYTRVDMVIDLHLLPYFGKMSLDQITKSTARKYQTMRLGQRKGKRDSGLFVKPSTINLEIAYLHAILNRALEDTYITINHLTKLKKLDSLESKPHKMFTSYEMELIYKVAKYPHWWKLLVNTGIRSAEARALKWENVKLEVIDDEIKRHLVIESTNEKRTKSGRYRLVPINASAWEALQVFKQEDNEDNYVFPRILASYFSQRGRADIKRAGLTGTPHKYRHTWCSLSSDSGMAPKAIQTIMGHANLATTEIYLHYSDEAVKRTEMVNI